MPVREGFHPSHPARFSSGAIICLVTKRRTFYRISIREPLPLWVGMNDAFARSISDASWGQFFEFLCYKAERQGKNILTIGRFEPSSKRCHVCGYIKSDLTLKDRDINAAKNIKAFAHQVYKYGRKCRNSNAQGVRPQ